MYQRVFFAILGSEDVLSPPSPIGSTMINLFFFFFFFFLHHLIIEALDVHGMPAMQAMQQVFSPV